MKKFIFILIFMILVLISACLINEVQAANPILTLTPNKTNVSAGDSVEVLVKLNKNGNAVKGMQLQIHMNDNVEIDTIEKCESNAIANCEVYPATGKVVLTLSDTNDTTIDLFKIILDVKSDIGTGIGLIYFDFNDDYSRIVDDGFEVLEVDTKEVAFKTQQDGSSDQILNSPSFVQGNGVQDDGQNSGGNENKPDDYPYTGTGYTVLGIAIVFVIVMSIIVYNKKRKLM